ncbi:MAG TPA: hypothetical protein VKY22_25880 [Bradyrhizobium sp.]|nr:hypothetical protein [Bradyrhizobium sp.]
MDFESANPSVVRSIKQRVLLNAWTRGLQSQAPLPAIAHFQPDGLSDELPDMMAFDVDGSGDDVRFFITHEGWRLAAAYGNEHLDPAQRINRYLDVSVDPVVYARVLPCYMTCIRRKRPTYSIAQVKDEDGKDVSFERLLLPFGSGETVEKIIGSYKAISIHGGFKVENLMGLRADTRPVRLLNAVVDQDLARRPPGVRISDDIVEAD